MVTNWVIKCAWENAGQFRKLTNHSERPLSPGWNGKVNAKIPIYRGSIGAQI